MNFTKSLLIATIVFIASNCYELDYTYHVESKDCGAQSKFGQFATVYMFFKVNMGSLLYHYRTGPVINIPCDRLDSYKIQFELMGEPASIKDTDTEAAPVLYNAAMAASAEMSVTEAVEYIKSDIITMTDPVVKSKVIYKLNKAIVTLHFPNPELLKKLEEYGVQYEPGLGVFEISQEMKTKVQQAMEEIRRKREEKEMQMTKSMEQDIMDQLRNGQQVMYETRGGQKYKVTVEEKLYVRGNDGILREVIKY